VLDYFCTNCNFNRLDGSKEQSPKLFVKGIKGYNVSKATAIPKLVCNVVNFKISPVTCKAKITDGVKHLNSLLNIINKQTSLFENINLLFCSYGLMCISNSHK